MNTSQPATALPPRRGVALVVSGPSGAGKSTVCRLVLAGRPAMRFSVSCTTRAPRAGETDGVDYHFLGRPEFEAKIAAGEFLEHAEVHGNFYGTLRAEVEPFLHRGGDVLLDIDVQGARQVRRNADAGGVGGQYAFVFLAPPSLAELERRLRGRQTDAEEVILRRLANARREIAAWREYDYLVINDTVGRAAGEMTAILDARRCAAGAWIGDPLADAESA